jgi:hypothetical protein
MLVGGVAMLAAAPASATTFCVPGFHAACPNNGTNVAEPSLGTAMLTNGDDTVSDKIVIDAGTVSQAGQYNIDSGDNDDLEIVGAGPASTVITSTQTGNVFLMNLNGARDVTMRDLTLRVPASLNDNQGGALQAEQDTFENVDIESRNVRSDGISSFIGGGTFRDGRVYGSMGGSIDTAFSGNGAASGEMLIERTVIDSPSWGILSDDPEVTVRVRRVRITDPLAYGLRITDGAFMAAQNIIIDQVHTGYPVIAESNDPGTVIASVRHSTIAGPPDDQNDPAVKALVQNAVGNGAVNLVVSDTIIAGFQNPLWCEAPSAANVGNASLTARYSYFWHSATILGDCTISNPNTIDAFSVGEPQFAGPSDYHRPASSPAIDTGDPLTVTLPTDDYDGAPRPVDGNADGTARRDMGAYEYQPPVVNPPGGDPPSGDPPPSDPPPSDPPPSDPPPDPPAGDKQPPLITKLKAKRGFSEVDGGIVKLRLSEAATVSLTARRIGAGGSSKKPAVRLSYPGVAGKNKLAVKSRKLKAGRYRLKVIATDAAANRSKAARAKLRVGP